MTLSLEKNYTFIMNNTAKNSLYSFLYLLSFYLGIKLLPLKSWCGSLTWLSSLIFIALYLIIIFLEIYESKKLNVSFEKKKHINYLFLLPLILGCMSNFLYCWFFNVSSTTYINDVSSFIFDSILCLLGVIIEEYLFRYIFLFFLDNYLKESKYKNLFLILLSSIAFSLMHCINFYGNNPINVLLQLGYTFALGLIFSYIMLSFDNIYVAIIGHFLFNYLNTNLFISFYSVETNYKYILFSLGICLFVLIYLVLIFYLNRRKQKRFNEKKD